MCLAGGPAPVLELRRELPVPRVRPADSFTIRGEEIPPMRSRILVAMLVLAACGSPPTEPPAEPPNPQIPSIAGLWAGQIVWSDGSTPSAMEAEFSQSDGSAFTGRATFIVSGVTVAYSLSGRVSIGPSDRSGWGVAFRMPGANADFYGVWTEARIEGRVRFPETGEHRLFLERIR